MPAGSPRHLERGLPAGATGRLYGPSVYCSGVGAIAQLGERLPRTEEVGGSNPLRSTKPPGIRTVDLGKVLPVMRLL